MIDFFTKNSLKLDEKSLNLLKDIKLNTIFKTNKIIRKMKIFFSILLTCSVSTVTSFKLVSIADELIFQRPKIVSKKFA
jgi:hypothetical protein